MKCKEFFKIIEKFIPIETQEIYDNCGLQIGNPNEEIKGIVYSVDVNLGTINFAIENKCNLIISHHPFIFKGIKRIDLSTKDGEIIEQSIKNKIVIYSAHTNFDKFHKGVSAALANQLNLKQMLVLEPEKNNLKKLVTFCPENYAETLRKALFDAGAGNIGNYDACSFNASGFGTFRAGENTNPFVGQKGELHKEPEVRIETVFEKWNQKKILKALFAFHPYEEVAFDVYSLDNEYNKLGLGVLGQLEKPMSSEDFLGFVKKSLNVKILKHNDFFVEKINKVAVCGGAGISLLNTAISSGAQAFITADLKYHDFQAASDRILLIDAGHFETEIFALEALKSFVSENLSNFVPQFIFPDTNWVKIF